jgi:23S rRNA pseudouridine2605 synthase
MTDSVERIAKYLSRAGVASRREAERMIAEGRVSVNGRIIDSPALNVGESDAVQVDGRPVAGKEPVRLWRYHKPAGLVTTASDEKGRATVFDHLPDDMPRVMSIGRLDLTSEGLLLLTNDGGLKRRLELPATGWVRKYRVRANGLPADETLEPLRRGVVVDGERFQPMSVRIDRQQGANVWLTIGLREGKNREIRRALDAVGLRVNRLIRISYGPFLLGDLAEGAVEEVRPRVMREQLGEGVDGSDGRAGGGRGAGVGRKAGNTDAKVRDSGPAPGAREAPGQDAPWSPGAGAQKAPVNTRPKAIAAGDGAPRGKPSGKVPDKSPADGRGKPPAAGRGKPPAAGRGKPHGSGSGQPAAGLKEGRSAGRPAGRPDAPPPSGRRRT